MGPRRYLAWEVALILFETFLTFYNVGQLHAAICPDTSSVYVPFGKYVAVCSNVRFMRKN